MQKHKILAAVIALPAAVLLWLYVVTVVSPNSNTVIRDIPISFEGTILLEERELIMTSGGSSVTLKVTGDRVNLTKLTNQNIRVVADLSKVTISEPGTYWVPLSVSIPDIAGKVSYDFQDKNKAQTEITVSKLVTKTIPIELDIGNEKAMDGFFFDSGNATCEPSEITVSGPDYEVDAISRAVIDCKDISTLTETVVEPRPIILEQADGTAAEPALSAVSQTEATVSLPIQQYMELKIWVDLKEGGGATAEDVESLHFSSETVLVRGSSAQIERLNPTLIVGTVDLAKITATNNTKTFSVTLPSGIKNVNGIDQVDVTVKLKGLRVQTYLVFADSIVLLHIPQNAKVKVNVEKIAVKLRGPEADIAAINAEDIRITLDLSGVSESGEVPAIVSIEGYPKVAVLEDVYVGITVS